MKAGLKRPSGKTHISLLQMLLAVIMLVAIGFVIYFTQHHDSSSAPKPKDTAVSFDVSTTALVGPNCSYPTPLGCFIPTDSQRKTLDQLDSQGYALAHITGKGHSDYEMIRGTVPKAPTRKLKALHVSDLTSSKGVGQKHQ